VGLRRASSYRTFADARDPVKPLLLLLPALSLTGTWPEAPRHVEPIQPYADELVCRSVDCSGHGRCFAERNRPYCVCDEGYADVGVRCAPARTITEHTLDREKIVSVAEAQDGHGPFGVGGRVTAYPYQLSRYLTPNDLWCSDFISWVYRAAGAPLTGGANGGWLIEGNYGVRYWFSSRGRWLARGTREFAAYTPRPGDYVRIHTNRYGHSGIVRYVEGDTLFTVEGNVGNRVRLRRHDHFRTDERIDGIGLIEPR
jgi:hypothetical protein